jgi:sec-independent protein translocase protein TatB
VFLDLNFTKILVLAVVAIIVFGPDQLPKLASQAGRTLRELRRMADGATRELREGLGPEFADFEVSDLHPGNFVRKHLFDEPSATAGGGVATQEAASAARTATATLGQEETPPFDSEAT